MAFDIREAEKRTKALIVYHSVTGRTLQRSREVSKGLMQANIEPVIEHVDGLRHHHIEDYPLIIFACSSLLGKPHHKLKTFFDRLPENSLDGKACAVFASNMLFDAHGTIETVEGWAESRGAAVIKSATVVSVLPSVLLTQSMVNAENERCIWFGKMVGLLAQEHRLKS